MSKRLQVLVSDEELLTYKKAAGSRELTVGEWVRQSLDAAARSQDAKPAERKLKAIRRALKCDFPAPGIEQMNREIEEGYLSGPH